MAITTTETALLRLLQLSSAALPVGGYSYSQGIEYAIEQGWLPTEQALSEWLRLQIKHSLSSVDLPLLQRQLIAVSNKDVDAMTTWNAYTLACRETSELRFSDIAMGAALCRLMADLDMPLLLANSSNAVTAHEVSFVSAFAMAAGYWGIDSRTACHGYTWSWLENQIAAATKLVPLGQTSAQRLLGELLSAIPDAINYSSTLPDQGIGASLPAVAMASSWHETQYTRLFRS